MFLALVSVEMNILQLLCLLLLNCVLNTELIQIIREHYGVFDKLAEVLFWICFNR